MTDDNIRRFPLQQGLAESSPPIASLHEAIRMIEAGEIAPTGLLIFMVEEDPENESFGDVMLFSGESMGKFSRVVGWLEILKALLLREMG